MKKGERKKIREKISLEINTAIMLIAALEESSRLPLPDTSAGRFNLRELIRVKSANERQLRPAKARLNKLESALKKIDDPDFGICFICEQPIPLTRLMEMPESTRCIRC